MMGISLGPMRPPAPIEVETTTHDEDVVIFIADNGVGIPKSIIDRIFDPLFTTKSNGTGLGLTVSLSIVREHSGNIMVESEENKGSKFTVTIPKIRGEE